MRLRRLAVWVHGLPPCTDSQLPAGGDACMRLLRLTAGPNTLSLSFLTTRVRWTGGFAMSLLGYASEPGWSTEDEFEFGLDMILEGLERRRNAEWPGGTTAAAAD